MTDHGKVIAQIVPAEAKSAVNPFVVRKLLKSYSRLLGKLKSGTDSTLSVSEDRDRV